MDLKRFFYPETVAVIGASNDPTKIGYQIVSNLKSGGYGGNIVPVNRNGNEILGLRTYKSIMDYNGKVDLAIVSVPASYTPAVAEECGKKGVFGIVVVASGFAEAGNTKLENELSAVCKKHNLRLLGPNVVGIMNSTLKLNASFAPYLPYPGSIGMISQSGAMIIALDARTLRDKVGMSHLISIGNMADLGFPEVISFMNQDQNVSCMSIYAEGIKNGREFVETARTIKNLPKRSSTLSFFFFFSFHVMFVLMFIVL
jgi:acetyltransferase